MILNGQFVDNTVVGGPAYNSKRISRGDLVLKVNQLPVNDQNVLEVVAGDDTPGSIVQLAIAKGGRNVFPHFNISMFTRVSDYNPIRARSKQSPSRGWRPPTSWTGSTFSTCFDRLRCGPSHKTCRIAGKDSVQMSLAPIVTPPAPPTAPPLSGARHPGQGRRRGRPCRRRDRPVRRHVGGARRARPRRRRQRRGHAGPRSRPVGQGTAAGGRA